MKDTLKLQPETSLALDAYAKAAKAETALYRATNNLYKWSSQVPAEDMAEYVRVTQEMEEHQIKIREKIDEERNGKVSWVSK